MPFSELPQAFLVALFLGLFVLVGIYPALQRTAAKLRKLLEEAEQKGTVDPLEALFGNLPDVEEPAPVQQGPLSDMELILLRRIAQDDPKAISLAQLSSALLLEKPLLRDTLKHLSQRRLVRLTLSPLLSPRFALSKTGRSFAEEQGYLVHLHVS